MKKILIIFFFIIGIFNCYSQAPQGISYQAIARTPTNKLLVNQLISLRFSIHNSGINGAVDYCELHHPITNNLGLFTLTIGQGTPITGTFNNIDWSSGLKFLQVEMDDNGGNDYINLGTQQLLSVPFALYSESSKNSNCFTHYIGERFGGGIVFYVYKHDGIEHGLIASLSDFTRDQSQQWSNVNQEIGITAQSHWDGLSNSIAIVNQQGHITSAAKLCLDYIFTDSTGTYDDWYLPADEEMKLIFQQKFVIEKYYPDSRLGIPIENGTNWNTYWTSTEFYRLGEIYAFNWLYEGLSTFQKTDYLSVRAIRKF